MTCYSVAVLAVVSSDIIIYPPILVHAVSGFGSRLQGIPDGLLTSLFLKWLVRILENTFLFPHPVHKAEPKTPYAGNSFWPFISLVRFAVTTQRS